MGIATKLTRYGVLVILAGVLIYIMIGVFFQKAPVKVGEAAPDFSGVDFKGSPLTLQQYKGKTVVINFFTTWCDPCKQEAPDLAKFNQTLPKDVVFLMIDRKEEVNVVAKFANDYHLSNPIFMDFRDQLAAPYGLTGQPETFFIDTKGIVRFHQLGPLTANELQQFLSQTVL